MFFVFLQSNQPTQNLKDMSIKSYSDEKLFELLVKALFENMPSKQTDLCTLADKLNISTSQLNRRVRASTGKTAKGFVTQIRIEESKRLLGEYPNISVLEVSQRCGFADTAHFCHVFRRCVGMSPTQYTKTLAVKDSSIEEHIRRQVNLARREQ